ncbi:four-carbon acid sugar kinase family protein [Amycolatopsis ultiminotia]|uniref:3-oxo-tetronate kinase n=1 Tax=Amycolatopsis ultiminotia TaxID=543629 RepID=A0ABP6V639_9PSEU
MLIGVIADDFTGASDIANTLAKGVPGQGGLVAMQYMGVPEGAAGPEVEAGVISLKSRSVPADDAVASSLAALHWLKAQGCRQIVFKYCSTFDSMPAGNIGPVAEALADALDVKGVVACPAFPVMRRTVYQGHLFVGDKLLNESGMQNHPLTPMTDADVRRWLRLQTESDVGHVPAPVVGEGAEAIDAAIRACADRGETLVIVDAVTDEDLVRIGQACADAPLLTGGSGIALGLAGNFIAKGLATGDRNRFEGVAGTEAILAGSCSGRTRSQVDTHARKHPTMAVAVEDVMDGRTSSDDLVAFIEANHGEAPLVYSSAAPEDVTAAQTRYGAEAVSDRLEGLFAETVKRLVDGSVSRVVVAGGETSGAVAQALDLGGLKIGPEISPGVPVLFSDKRGVALALKSGNFGGEDFFDQALDALAGEGAVHE